MELQEKDNCAGRELPVGIREFILRVRRRLNRAAGLLAAVRAVFVCASIAVVYCLYYVLRGFAVPAGPLVYLAGLLLLCWVLFYLAGRFSFMQAVVFADREFGLQDSLQSACEFCAEGNPSPFKDLDIENTCRSLEGIDPAGFHRAFPARFAELACLLCLVVVMLGMLPQSPEVTRRFAEIERVNRASSAAAEEMRKGLEEEEEKLGEEARQVLKKTEVPEKIAGLEARDNMKDSLRDYARLENELHKVARQNDPAAEQRFYRELSKLLLQQKQTAGLGRELSRGDFQKAAQKMREFSLGQEMSAERLRNRAGKLQKLANALEKSLESSQNISRNSNLSKDIKSLSKSLSQLSKSKDCKSGNCRKACRQANKALSRICRSMGSIPARQRLGAMMRRLLARSGNCQNKMRADCNGGECNKPSQKDSNKWGNGGAGNFDNTVKAQMARNSLQLEGIIGEGESEKSVVSASTGEGGATMPVEKRKRAFRRSAENFVMREDVPGEYKRGVKKYFNSINLAIDDEGTK